MKGFFQKAAACVAAVCLLAGLCACGSSTGGGSEVLARVEDQTITEQELEDFCAISMQMMGYDAEVITEEQKDQFLNEMVEMQVVQHYFAQKDQDIYGEEYESYTRSFVESAHESVPDFLEKYSISDEALEKYYRNQFAVSALFMEIESEYAKEDLSAQAKEYYEEHKEDFRNSDGSYEALEDVIQPVYYSLYSEFYQKKVDELKEGMKIEIR